jgi:3',5'-cyclic AMP phosphodiesterase CpdA
VRLAHLSDLHLLDLTGAVPRRLFNKRLTGYANLRLRRGHRHKPEPVRLAARALGDLKVDHVAITGDVSNLALEREFDRVRELLEAEIGLDPEQVSVVPGNHDAYTSGSVRAGRFGRWFSAYTSSDIEDVPGESGFPYVRLRGKVAIIGLSTAVSRPPFVASGHLGREQLERLALALAHPEVRERTPVVLQHHPLHNPRTWLKTLLEGLVDARAEADVLSRVERGLLLHGHLHRRIRRTFRTQRGSIDAVGATSASLLHEDPDRMAGFNLYDIDESGHVHQIGARRLSEGTFVEARVPVDET